MKSDKNINIPDGGVAQLVRASACHAEGRRFKSVHPRHLKTAVNGGFLLFKNTPLQFDKNYLYNSLLMKGFVMKKLCLLLGLFLLTGCVSRTSEFGIIAPENTRVSAQELQNARIVKNVKASSDSFIFIIIPFGHPNLEDVVEKAMAQGKGQLLTNVKVEHAIKWFVLFGFNELNLTADVIQLRGGNQ